MSRDPHSKPNPAFKDIVEVAEHAILEALETLLGDVPTTIVASEVGVAHTPESQVAAIITISGEVNGLISLHSSEALASKLARTLLHIERSDKLSEFEIRDSFGELCNIVAGHICNRCGEQLNLSIHCGLPTVMLPIGGIAVPSPSTASAAAVIHAKVAFCPLTLYLCLAQDD